LHIRPGFTAFAYPPRSTNDKCPNRAHNVAMENRRKNYRQPMSMDPPLHVAFHALDGKRAIRGEIVNLSIGGICAIVPEMASEQEAVWIATFSLNPLAVPLRMCVECVYRSSDLEGYYGFRFLQRGEPRELEDEERRIWRYLLHEQCRLRKVARESR
jgi:c-di-GMP-binding flagellar brake protein YcgR